MRGDKGRAAGPGQGGSARRRRRREVRRPPGSIPDSWRSSATRPTASPACPAGAPSRPPPCWPVRPPGGIPGRPGTGTCPCAAGPPAVTFGGRARRAPCAFKDLATLRIDRSLLARAEDLRWRGPTGEFARVLRGRSTRRVWAGGRRRLRCRPLIGLPPGEGRCRTLDSTTVTGLVPLTDARPLVRPPDRHDEGRMA